MCDAPSLYATRAATLLPISLSLLLPLAGVPTNFVRAQSLRRPGAGRAGRSRSRPGAQPGAGRAGHCVRLQCWHTQGTASVRPKCERCDAILASSSALLEECASTGAPTPGTAKEIFGKLFAVPLWSRWPRQCFSLIIPLVQRCNDARDTSLNNALREMLRFRKIILHRDNLPSRTSDSVSPSDLRSWSAPTPARAQVRGLGVVIHDAEDPVHGRSYAADVCPPWLAHTFLQHGDSSICPPKPLAALCALLTASERLRNRRVYLCRQ